MMFNRRCLVAVAVITLVMAASPAFAAESVSAGIQQCGLFLTLLGIFGLGILVSITPCMYPMIPITLSVIGARSVGSTPLTGFLRSLMFVLGIAVIYSSLGVVSVLMGTGIDALFQYKTFWLFLSIFFAAMGVSMLGYFDLQLPPVLQGKLQSKVGNKGGYIGAFLIGMVTGIGASPCGSPVLASLILYGTQADAQIYLTIAMFFAYSLGMGMLFLVLGAFPALLRNMPKSGFWMEDVKKLLGVILIGVGVYYVKNAFPQNWQFMYWPLVAAVCLAGAGIIAVKARMRETQPGLLMGWRVTGIALVALAVFAAFKAIPDLKIRVNNTVAIDDQSTTGTAVARPEGELNWLTSEADALAQAKATGKPLMVDFTADWCAICKVLEKETFNHESVKSRLADFILLKIDDTEGSEENEVLRKKYKAVSLPTVAFVRPDGTWIEDLNLYTESPPAEFLQRLEKANAGS